MSEGPAKRQKLDFTLVDLPRLVLDLIMRHLPGKDALALSHVNGKLLKVGSMDRLWKYLIERDFGLVVEKNCKVVYWEEWRFVEGNRRGQMPVLIYYHNGWIQRKQSMKMVRPCQPYEIADKNDLDQLILACILWHTSTTYRYIYIGCCIRRGVDINPKSLRYWEDSVLVHDHEIIRFLLSFDHDQSGWEFDSLIEFAKEFGTVEILTMVKQHANSKNRHLKNYPV